MSDNRSYEGMPPGWQIDFNPKPIPTRDFDWDYSHESHDGENGLCGTASSPEDAVKQIINGDWDL